MYRASKLVGKKRIITVGVAVSVFIGASIAAAAEGVHWSESAPAVSQPVPTTGTATTTPPSPEPTPDGTGGSPQDTRGATPDATTSTVEHETVTYLNTPAIVEQPSEATTIPPTVPGPAPLAADEPTTTATAQPEPPAPTTTEFHDTVVPQGISLSCTAEGGSVSCAWSSPDVPGFARVMLLRGNGGTKGRVPFQSNDSSAVSYIDPNVPAGSYSYVVVILDGNSHMLLHSNPVLITIDAAG